MTLPWLPRFVYAATDTTLSLPVRPWDFLENVVGGEAEAASNVRAAFVVRRDQQLALPLRFFEEEWPLVRALIEYGQTGLPIEWFPDASDTAVSFDIYLDAPEVGDQFTAEPDGEYPQALYLTLVVRQADGLGWDDLAGYFEVEEEVEPPPPPDPVYTLEEVSTGLIARHEFDNASYPFSLADWTAHAGLTLSLSGGALRGTLSVGGALRAARYDPAGVLSRVWVQQVARGITVGTSNLQPSPAAHVSAGATPDDYIRYCWTIARSPSDLVALQEIINSASVVSTTQNTTARVVNVDHRTDLYVDGAACLGYDYTEAIEKSIAAGTLVSGGPGISANSGGGAGGVIDWRRFFVMSHRELVVTGLPVGTKAQVRDGSGTLLAEAAAVVGTATVDLWKKVMPAVKVEVRTTADVLLADLTPPDGVWGGSQFLFTVT